VTSVNGSPSKLYCVSALRRNGQLETASIISHQDRANPGFVIKRMVSTSVFLFKKGEEIIVFIPG
jgi:hypothetical protein